MSRPAGVTSGACSSIQFDKRMKVLERDRGKTIADIETAVLGDIAAEELEEVGAPA